MLQKRTSDDPLKAGILDNTVNREANPLRLTVTFLAPFIIVLTLLFAIIVSWLTDRIRKDQISEMTETSRAFLEQIMVTRIWNTEHGGVYVEATPQTPPNPSLEDPHREITSVDGKRYTKINPAYMTRQLSEIANLKSGYKFRLVSLNPVNHYTVPDEWEAQSLQAFRDKTLNEATTVYGNEKGIKYFRYLAPIKIEDPCMKCHTQQGFRHGEISRGGISISIPMQHYDATYRYKTNRLVFSFLVVALVSIIFVGSITYWLSHKLSSEIEKNIERGKLAAIIELSGAAAHELRQPMTVVQNLLSLSRDKLKNNEPMSEEEMGIMSDQCARMNDIIKKMLSITSYKTKDYIKGKKIVDLAGSSNIDDQTKN